MRILTLDFETYDPNIRKYGSGWCFKYHYPEVEFEVLGCGLITHDGEEIYIDFRNDEEPSFLLRTYIEEHDAILCHNSLYDIGILKYLFKGQDEIWSTKLLIDTMLLAKHDNQSRFSYGLDSLCKDYSCTELKESNILYDFAWESGIYQKDHKDRTGRTCHTRPSEKVLHEWCMADMRRFTAHIVEEYCLQDVRATKALYNLLQLLTSYLDYTVDSDILKVCIECKVNGVRIDLNKSRELLAKNKEIISDEENIVFLTLGCPDNFNINSHKNLAKCLLDAGYKLPKTINGNYSINKEWLDDQPEEIYKHIRRYRKAVKVNEYIQKLINYQEVIPGQYIKDNIGWLYPSLKPYGATATGRFSSGGGTGCNELNIQQIPRRDEEFSAPLRDIFIAHENEVLVCADFSSQESRLQVHYAAIMGCTGAAAIKQQYIDIATTDFHELVANICRLSRENAKTINLGLSYGMGQAKLILKLGVGYEEGSKILKQYHKLLPFLRQLQNITTKTMEKNNYIKTIGGRKLRLGEHDYASKALNKLIQGSAGDQIVRSMIAGYKAGLKILFSVHDEIVISSKCPDTDKKLLEDVMCNSVKLCLPMYVDSGVGESWGKAK